MQPIAKAKSITRKSKSIARSCFFPAVSKYVLKALYK